MSKNQQHPPELWQPHYAHVLENMGESYVAVDAEGRFIYVNAAAERAYAMRRKDVLGESLWTVFPEGTNTAFEDGYRRAMRERVPVKVGSSVDRLNGWVDVDMVPLDDGGVSFFFRDTRRLKQAEAAAAANERRLRLFLEDARDYALILLDQDGNVSEWLGAAPEICGWSAEEAIGRSFSMLFTAEDRAARRPQVEMALAARTGRAEDTRWHLRKDGTYFFADGVTTAFRDIKGELQGFGKIFRDVSAQKLADEELQQNRRQFQLLLDSVGEGICGVNRAGICIFLNPAGADILGFTSAQLVGHPVQGLIHDTRLGSSEAMSDGDYFTRAIYEGRSLRSEDGALGRRDGTIIPVQYSINPMVTDDDITGAVIAFTDISARRRAEDSLREQDRRKNEFLATLAHELRNPLAPLRTGLELLAVQGNGDGDQSTRIRDMMRRQLAHMVHLIDDLMDVSRVSSGKVALKFERISLSSIIESALEVTEPTITAARHMLSIHLPDAPVYVQGDATRLAQVVSNLLSNAAKYTPPGGAIKIIAREEGDEIAIRVSDTGVGIAADMLPKVFDLFTQVDPSIDRAQGGLGIGLSLVQQLMELHGGSVTAESPGLHQGSTFTLRLKRLVDTPPPVTEDKQIQVQLPLAGKRLLIVDDNVDAAEALALLLRFANHEVKTAYSGTEAVSAVKKFRPDAVFLDLGLPGLSGYEVAALLRQDPSLQKLVIIALTGWGNEEDRRRSQAAGFDLHLVKPADIHDVTSALEQFFPAV